ncbi:MAG: hypothetical protein KF773_03230 [Deltaproteobacteria bacterium]|nr:hypothetical protein [Deltaproteobacteria bacterium]MCW5802922.1 hypothetical protein [Deltaproteobacteria bacterium]
MTTPESEPKVLAGAGVPADQGLSTLGLLMQLAGTILAAQVSLVIFSALFVMRADRTDSMWVFLMLGLCIARSMFHRQAGTELLYGRRPGLDGNAGNPLTGLKRYIVVALVQSALLALIAYLKFKAPGKVSVAMFAGLIVWPATLGALLASGRFKRFNEGIPVAEDKGFEGAAILMTVFGLCGALATGAILIVVFQKGGKSLQQGPGVLMIVALVKLFLRSSLHVQAGVTGLRETSLDRAVELANRYANFGIITAFSSGGALLLIAMTEKVNLGMIVVVTCACWLLMAWPMIIRRFFSERQFADLLAGDNAAVHHRAPDGGLTGLGWMLVGMAMLTATTLLPSLIAGSDGNPLAAGGMAGMRGLGESAADLFQLLVLGPPTGYRSTWWNAGLVMFQLWAGYELIRLSPYSRIIATAFAVVGAGVIFYLSWPSIEIVKNARSLSPVEQLTLMAPIAIHLIVPIATLILANRTIAPSARARFRTRPSQPSA